MKLGLLIFSLGIVAVLSIGCLGGDNDTVAPQGDCHLRIYNAIIVSSVDQLDIRMDDQLLWSADSLGQLSEPLWVSAGHHQIQLRMSDDTTDFYKMNVNLVSQGWQMLIVTEVESLLIPDHVQSTQNSPKLRLVNALANPVAVDLRDQFHAAYFIDVLPNQATSFRSMTPYHFDLIAYRSGTDGGGIAGMYFETHLDSAYTLVLFGGRKFSEQMRLIVDPIQQ